MFEGRVKLSNNNGKSFDEKAKENKNYEQLKQEFIKLMKALVAVTITKVILLMDNAIIKKVSYK